ncbi:MAG: hypothetical protein M5U17_07800 [Ignavibacterium sp.]|nr:hypothetical protein [Ignavibacterium sp.]
MTLNKDLFNNRITKVSVIIITSILIVFLLLQYYSYKAEKIRLQNYQRLSAINKTKTSEILRWYKERIIEVDFMSTTQPVLSQLKKILANPSDKQASDFIIKTLTSIKVNHEYNDIVFSDTNGNVLISFDSSFKEFRAKHRKRL